MDLTSVLDSPTCGDVDISVSLLSAPTRTARCADGNGTFSGLFFSDDDVDVARAKAICRRCVLSTECLEGALRRAEAYGVWGGVLLIDGQAARFPVRRGRPSKTARIEHVADEVQIPEHLVA